MKNVYMILLFISMLCLTGDCDSFIMFVLWEAVWFMVFLFCSYQLGEENGREKIRF